MLGSEGKEISKALCDALLEDSTKPFPLCLEQGEPGKVPIFQGFKGHATVAIDQRGAEGVASKAPRVYGGAPCIAQYGRDLFPGAVRGDAWPRGQLL